MKIMDINRLYEVYPSTVLEGFRKKKEYQKVDMVRDDFFRYLKQQYPDFNKKEFTNAKTKEEAQAVANKYKDDFERFIKNKNKKILSIAAYLGFIAGDFTGIIPRDVANKIYAILTFKNAVYWTNELKKGF